MPPPSLHSPPRMTARDIVIGVAWGLGAAACHAFVPIAVRMLSPQIPTIELVFFRNIIGLSIVLSIVSWGGFGFMRTARIGAHLQRNVLNFVGMWLWFAGLAMLPLAKAVALHFTVPLMVVPLAILFLKERPGALRLFCTLLGFGGVLIILRPGAVPIGWAAMLVLGSALCYAGVGIFTRALGRTEAPATTTFYYQAMLSVFALVPSLFVWVTPGVADIPALVLLAVSGTAAPYCMVRGMVHAEVTIIGPIEYLRLPITATLAWIIFSETTDRWTWVGAVVIVGAAYYMARQEHKAAG
ncbi:MAG: EamA family transporter [Rhodospirillaceae bacterium]|jgi:drug/metabolite transporter (DMT)-like permease|nr:EamA family transporter [Rhodospirillaceae bacterium]